MALIFLLGIKSKAVTQFFMELEQICADILVTKHDRLNMIKDT